MSYLFCLISEADRFSVVRNGRPQSTVTFLLYPLYAEIFLCHKNWWMEQYLQIRFHDHLSAGRHFLFETSWDSFYQSFPKKAEAVFCLFCFVVFLVSFKLCSSKCEHQPAASTPASPGRFSEMQNFRLHPRPTESAPMFLKHIHTILAHVNIWETRRWNIRIPFSTSFQDVSLQARMMA